MFYKISARDGELVSSVEASSFEEAQDKVKDVIPGIYRRGTHRIKVEEISREMHHWIQNSWYDMEKEAKRIRNV